MFILRNQFAANRAPRSSNTSILMILAVLAGAAFAAPARANTYKFAIPSATIQTALFNGLAQPQQYAFYDIYLRPRVSVDFVIANVANPLGGQTLPDYAIVDFASPLPTGADRYDASASNAAPNDGGRATAEYKYAAGDTVQALLSPNVKVVGKSYETGLTAELMPASTFSITISSTVALSGPVRFRVRAVGYLFADAEVSALGILDKGQAVTGYFDMVGTEAPEPGALFLIGTGLGLLALLGARRRRAPAAAS